MRTAMRRIHARALYVAAKRLSPRQAKHDVGWEQDATQDTCSLTIPLAEFGHGHITRYPASCSQPT